VTHDEAGALLGAYVLDATSEEEREALEAHVSGCAHCQAELAAHREIAALMAAGLSTEVPARVWEQVAASTFLSGSHEAQPPPRLVPLSSSKLARARREVLARRARGLALGLGGAAAAAAIVLASVFGTEVGQLHSQVRSLEQQVGAASVAEAAALAAAGPHVTVALAAADGSRAATVVVAPKGFAYWISSSLGELPASETYQLWGLVEGKPVSLGLLGPDPRQAGLFRVGKGTSKLMVTAEPAGGAPSPTTAVLAVGTLPSSAVEES